MPRISTYSTVNLLETIEMIEDMATDLMRTAKDTEDYPPHQVTYVAQMNNDIAHYNNGIVCLKCAILRELKKGEDDE